MGQALLEHLHRGRVRRCPPAASTRCWCSGTRSPPRPSGRSRPRRGRLPAPRRAGAASPPCRRAASAARRGSAAARGAARWSPARCARPARRRASTARRPPRRHPDARPTAPPRGCARRRRRAARGGRPAALLKWWATSLTRSSCRGSRSTSACATAAWRRARWPAGRSAYNVSRASAWTNRPVPGCSPSRTTPAAIAASRSSRTGRPAAAAISPASKSRPSTAAIESVSRTGSLEPLEPQPQHVGDAVRHDQRLGGGER